MDPETYVAFIGAIEKRITNKEFESAPFDDFQLLTDFKEEVDPKALRAVVTINYESIFQWYPNDLNQI